MSDLLWRASVLIDGSKGRNRTVCEVRASAFEEGLAACDWCYLWLGGQGSAQVVESALRQRENTKSMLWRVESVLGDVFDRFASVEVFQHVLPDLRHGCDDFADLGLVVGCGLCWR